jgi:hypothetical protein
VRDSLVRMEGQRVQTVERLLVVGRCQKL